MTRARTIVALCLLGLLQAALLRAADEHEHDRAMHEGATHVMSGHHLHPDAHMKMTERRPMRAGDRERADALVAELRRVLEPYKDYRRAIADGYNPFLPNLDLPMYHFTNWRYGFKAAFTFDSAKPTSLLYKKTAVGYELVGAMYTAPRRADEAALDERVPLSVAQWHQHVNICLPPRGKRKTADWKRFGFAGSIASEPECKEAGGRFHPVIFGWMVHVHPYENAPEKIWAH